jgi:hypothetical protein
LLVHEQHVIGGTRIGGVFADRLAFALVEVDDILVLNSSSGGAELRVDGVAGFLFGILVRHL